MDLDQWQPTCQRPPLTMPERADPTGRDGPTPRQARGRKWRQSSSGLFVPADVELSVEQRILEAAHRLPASGAVWAWASLRWRGAAYFTGEDFGERLPVPMLLGGGASLRPDPRVSLSKEQIPPREIEIVDGVQCSIVARALFDEMRRVGEREAVVAVDMTVAAGLITVDEMVAYIATRPAWTGVPRARISIQWATDHSRSPMESRMRLVWVIDAGLPSPLCNHELLDLDGQLLGVPDTFDVEAGMVCEYDGRDHLEDDRRASDSEREELFRDHGLEYLRVVRGQVSDRAALAARMHQVRRRARFLPPERRRWQVGRPVATLLGR